MRRFIKSVVGTVILHAAIVAMIWPSLTYGLSSKAIAQVQQGPTWAVVDFVCEKTPAVGVAAAESMQSALGKSGNLDLVPRETVDRTIKSLGMTTPVQDLTSLMRLGGELRAMSLVTGKVVDYRIVNTGGGKKADVLFMVKIIDVSSGLGINGTSMSASSSVRTGDADDMTVVNEALASAADQAVRNIRSQTLPAATILNTLEDSALINQGTRTGFRKGQELIVHRGREQVATARVSDVEPDSAIIHIVRDRKGIQPGDRVRVIFAVDEPKKFGADGKAVYGRKSTGGRPRTDFGSLVLVGGLLLLLFSNGRPNGFSPANDVSAEATMFPNFSGVPAVRLKWRIDLFARGNSTRTQWQIYRSDITGIPVLVIPGDMTEGFDDNAATRAVNYADFGGVVGGFTCDFVAPPNIQVASTGVIPGRPYSYTLALVYKIASIDLPDGGTTGTTTGGATTGTGGASDCFFISKQVSAKGVATPLDRPGLVSPGPNAVVATDIPFTFTSVVNPAFPTVMQYGVQISSDPNFPKNKSKVYGTIIRTDLGTLSTGSISNLLARLASDFGSATTQFFWRIGARNTADRPGPVADQSGERYVFSAPRIFTIPAPPPPPPSL